ncbi:MAG: hypothetical protein ABEI58_01190, partial [Candidatus Nanohaloarchaea archaeon]
KDSDTDSDPDSNWQQDSLTCDDDKAKCDDDTGSISCSSSTCSGTTCTDGSCSVSDSCNVDCRITDDQSGDEENDYWYTSGDSLKQESCTNDGGKIKEEKCKAKKCSGNGCSTSWSCGPSNEQTCSCSASGDCATTSDYDSAGDYRSWEQTGSKNCNTNNVVDGGGDTQNDEYGGKSDNDPAGTFTDFTAYGDDVSGASTGGDAVWCAWDSRLTVDADGPKGLSDGFVVIAEGVGIISTENPAGNDKVGQMALVNGGRQDYRSKIDTSCSGNYRVCLKYVDYYTEAGSSNRGSPDWTSAWDAVEIQSESYVPSDSYSVCKAVNRISGDEIVKCDWDDQGTGGPGAGPGNQVCGDQTDEYWAYMEGPEVNEGKFSSNNIDYQQCVDTRSDCVLRGKEVSEGTVANVAPDQVLDQYEEGTNSPDWEVCLNIDQGNTGGTGDDVSGDNYDVDLQGGQTEAGGEWFDLDDERVNQYLRNSGSGMVSSTKGAALQDSNGDGVADDGDIDFYWRKNQNPDDSEHNPAGSSWGIAVEDDCDPALSGCDDTNTASDNYEPLFYSNFSEGARDEDYHPQTTDVDAYTPHFNGYINNISDDSNQLEPGMNTSVYDSYSFDSSKSSEDGDITKWQDSRGGQKWADQFSVTKNLTTSISNRGKPYPAGSTYYRQFVSKRDNPDASTTLKTDKVFANSFADVASQSIVRDGSEVADAGDGVWIDPDYIKQGWDTGEYRYTQIFSSWQQKMAWNIDLTGPDSGLGLNTGDSEGITFKDGNRKWVMWGDVYFEGERDNDDNDGNDGEDEYWASGAGWTKVGESTTALEPPMCGDDLSEYLLEEIGESTSPAQYDGLYACTDSQDVCIDRSHIPKVLPSSTTLNVDEPDEEVGRLKRDSEFCGLASNTKGLSETVYKWWDQDYGDLDGDGNQETCQENSLYGREGVRWIESSYVKDHPYAVTGGIDDDWNQYIENQESAGEFSGSYTYKPGESDWSYSKISSNSWTPVPSGSPNQTVATLGFCGGDDDGEHLVTQKCQTSLCKDDNSVMGVASDQSYCILDGSKYPLKNSDNRKRKLYETGDSVTFDLSGSDQKISCFDGIWYDSWPIVFNQERMDVGSGDTRRVSFRIINVEDEQRKFNIEIQDAVSQPHIVQFTEFVSESGGSFTTTVDARSSKDFQVELYGGNSDIDADEQSGKLRIQAEAVDSPISGEDMLAVDVLSASKTNTTGNTRKAQPRNVPGLGMVHVLVLMMLSAVFFFTQS